MELAKVRQPPHGLGNRGRALWRDVMTQYTLRPDEIALLRNLCNAVDQLHRIELRLKAEHVTSTGSSGQLVGHPLLAEWRAHTDTIQRLVKQLHLPDIDRKQPRKPKMGGRVQALKAGGM